MRQIICKYEMFDMYQTIFLIDESGSRVIGGSPTNTLAEALISQCNQLEIFHIHLYGNEESLMQLKNKILTNTKYSQNTIEIEVN